MFVLNQWYVAGFGWELDAAAPIARTLFVAWLKEKSRVGL